MFDNSYLVTVVPEILLLVMACVTALLDQGVTSRLRHFTYVLTMLTHAALALWTGMRAAAAHVRDGLGQQLPRDLPGPGTAHAVQLCARRTAARQRRGLRSGDEVLRA